MCISAPVSPLAKRASSGISSAKSGLKESAPSASWASSKPRYQRTASGFVKSTMAQSPMPRSVRWLHTRASYTLPSGRRRKYPPATPSW